MTEDRTDISAPSSSGALSLFPELDKDLRDLSYTTGTLPAQDIEALIEAANILGARPIAEDQIKRSSLDLRMVPVAFRVQAGLLTG